MHSDAYFFLFQFLFPPLPENESWPDPLELEMGAKILFKAGDTLFLKSIFPVIGLFLNICY